MGSPKPDLSLLFIIISLTISMTVVQGAAPGERSKEMCTKYLEYVPKSYDCPFSQNSVSIGNEFAKEEEFPHMVMLGFEQTGKILWACSASLISDQYVLAAAHCLTNRITGPPVMVRLGVTNLTDTVHVQEIKVIETIPHPEYTIQTKYNDIGLVKLAKKVDINIHTRPACLFTEKEIGVKEVTNTGWGTTEFLGEFDNRLQKVSLELYDLDSCNKTYHKQTKISNGINYDTMVCAGTKSLVTYQPRSGGPLNIIHKVDGKPTCLFDIVGVASFGKFVPGAGIPDVYTRVSPYIKWIEDEVWK